MKRLIYRLIAIIAIFGIYGCDDILDRDDDDEYEEAPPGLVITFGTAYGFCDGENCIEIFKIENDLVYEDQTDAYPGLETVQESFSWELFEGEERDEAFEILEEYFEYENDIWALQDSTFGCPDCMDQGAIFFRVEKDGDARTFLIDTEAAYEDSDNSSIYPEAIRELAEEIMEVVEEINELD
jgi:hypothetical protein